MMDSEMERLLGSAAKEATDQLPPAAADGPLNPSAVAAHVNGVMFTRVWWYNTDDVVGIEGVIFWVHPETVDRLGRCRTGYVIPAWKCGGCGLTFITATFNGLRHECTVDPCARCGVPAKLHADLGSRAVCREYVSVHAEASAVLVECRQHTRQHDSGGLGSRDLRTE